MLFGVCIEKYCLFLPFRKYIQNRYNEKRKEKSGKWKRAS